jgi:hypothetical protein
MLQLVNWEDYSSLFDKVPEAEFSRYERLAEIEICNVIGPIRWANITEQTFGYKQLKDCVCNVVNALYESDHSAQGKGITSVSNDGYSESYAVQTATQAKAELQSMIKRWLSGTGLVGSY